MKHTLSLLHDKKVIIYGTGELGQTLAPYFRQEERIHMLGVCNSKTTRPGVWSVGEDEFPIDSIENWKQQASDAVIFIATIRDYHEEICKNCKDAGFDKINIICLPKRIADIALQTNAWKNAMTASGFPEKYLHLVSGLDAKSIQTVARILNRMGRFQKNITIDITELFTETERDELRRLEENFYPEILKLSDHLYAYQKYLLPIHHFEPSVFYYRHGLSMVEDNDYVKGKAIIDVGGFVGDSVLILSELNPSEIYTFEAVPENYELLEQTIKINRIPNVIPEKLALGAESGICTLRVSGSGSSIIDPECSFHDETIQAQMVTLDSYVEEKQLSIGLIKVDIEGAEPYFLAGAKRTICEQRPILLLSIYHNTHDFLELKPMIESWNLNYRFKIYKPTFRSIYTETLLIAESM